MSAFSTITRFPRLDNARQGIRNLLSIPKWGSFLHYCDCRSDTNNSNNRWVPQCSFHIELLETLKKESGNFQFRNCSIESYLYNT